MGYRIQVLDHGFVELLDVMGDEQEVARAARISYGRHEQQRTWEQDAKLTQYLWDNLHTTPFEMIELKFQAKMPIFVARQWVRHRTANINEFSMRYADPERLSVLGEIDYYVPETWRVSDPNNKQGSLTSDRIDPYWNTQEYKDRCDAAIALYKIMQARGVANEMARMVLPVSVYTEWVWKNDLHNTLHFLKLRTDEHAQWEMRQYANAMLQLLQERLPRLMEVVWPSRNASSVEAHS